MNLKKNLMTGLLLLLFCLPMVAAAQYSIPKPSLLPGPDPEKINVETKDGRTNQDNYQVKVFIPFLTTVFVAFAAFLSFITLILAGIKYITAYTEESTASAKRLIIWSLVGLLISIFSFAIVSIFTRVTIS